VFSTMARQVARGSPGGWPWLGLKLLDAETPGFLVLEADAHLVKRPASWLFPCP
jgi:hypothetical protein